MYNNGGLIFFLATFYITFLFAFVVIMIVALWKIFTKAGEKGWKSLIPLYNGYVLVTKIARKSAAYFWTPIMGFIFIPLIVAIVGNNGSKNIGIALVFIMIAFYIGLFVIAILLCIAISKNFGHSAGFAIGLILLPLIFSLILAFGDSKFIYSAKEDNLSDEDDEYEYIYVEEDEEE